MDGLAGCCWTSRAEAELPVLAQEWEACAVAAGGSCETDPGRLGLWHGRSSFHSDGSLANDTAQGAGRSARGLLSAPAPLPPLRRLSLRPPADACLVGQACRNVSFIAALVSQPCILKCH